MEYLTNATINTDLNIPLNQFDENEVVTLTSEECKVLITSNGTQNEISCWYDWQKYKKLLEMVSTKSFKRRFKIDLIKTRIRAKIYKIFKI